MHRSKEDVLNLILTKYKKMDTIKLNINFYFIQTENSCIHAKPVVFLVDMLYI